MIDLVVQGPQNDYGAEIIRHYQQIPWVNRIIVSCWDNENPEGDLVVKSWMPPNPGIGNRNCHIVSSLAGLKQVNTEFAAKVRSDQKISLDSMNLLYDRMMQNPEKIGALGFYKPFPFHPRDHSFWGRTENLIDLFDIPQDPAWYHVSNPPDAWPFPGFYAQNTRAECYIASQYLAKKDLRAKKMVDKFYDYLWDFSPKWEDALKLSEELMPKYFYPMPRIDFEWPKHGLSSYHYDWAAQFYGEFWSE